MNCHNLTDVNIPNGTVAIGTNAFRETALKEVIIPDSVSVIGASAFSGCDKLENVTLPNNIKVLSNNLFANCDRLQEIVIPDSVERIAGNTFGNCNLTITKGINVTCIDENNFIELNKFFVSEEQANTYALNVLRNGTKVKISIKNNESGEEKHYSSEAMQRYIEECGEVLDIEDCIDETAPINDITKNKRKGYIELN